MTAMLPIPKSGRQGVAQRGRRSVRILGQEQGVTVVVAGPEVRLVDAGIRQHETEPVLDDDHAGRRTKHFVRLAKDQFDQTRVLVDLPCEPNGLGARLHGR